MRAVGRRHRVRRALVTTSAVAGLAFVAVALVVRRQPVTSFPRLVISVGATFVPLVALCIVLLAIASRRFTLVLASVALLTTTIAIQVSWYYFGKPNDFDRTTDVRILASNLRLGLAEPQPFVELAEANADVVTVAELTHEAANRFDAAGIGRHFPYSVLLPESGAVGLGLWSRYPLTKVTAPRHRGVVMPAARLKIPGVDHDPLVASVHIMSPVAGDENTVNDWQSGMAGAKAQLDNFARIAGPAAVIVGGDYNSTPDMRQFRDLLTNGYLDAVQQTGAGYAPTFKADSWLPPVITIDHVLTRNAAASSVRTVKVDGSDHRALLATIKVPMDAK